jgi:nucleotide-binding universal stress UspA family protein
MFTHLIVPLDGTAESNVAVTQACVIARLTGARMSLLRVYSGSSPTPETMEFLHAAADQCGDRSGEIEVAALGGGDPARVIVEQVVERRADLVVMRTRGRAGLSRAVLGSVAEGIVKRSPTPVLLLPPQADAAASIRTILVPVDSSPGSLVALGAARELALVTHAQLRLVQIVVPTPMYLSHAFAGHGPIYIDPAWDEDAQSGAEAYVESLSRHLSAGGLQTEGKVLVRDSVSEAIVGHATEQDADLIVMSTEAHTGVARAVLGSVADGVVRTATCPVLVLRNTSEAPAEQASQ